MSDSHVRCHYVSFPPTLLTRWLGLPAMYSVLLLLANDFHASRLLLALLRIETHCTGQTSRPPLCILHLSSAVPQTTPLWRSVSDLGDTRRLEVEVESVMTVCGSNSAYRVVSCGLGSVVSHHRAVSVPMNAWCNVVCTIPNT